MRKVIENMAGYWGTYSYNFETGEAKDDKGNTIKIKVPEGMNEEEFIAHIDHVFWDLTKSIKAAEYWMNFEKENNLKGCRMPKEWWEG